MKMQILKLIVLIVLLFNVQGCKKNNRDVLYDRSYINQIKAARKEIFFYMARNFVPGASFAVAKEGKIIYSEGYGLASKDLEVPATRSTKFRIGDVSELFTSLLYHKLAENGILHPDSAVQHYFSGFPDKAYKVALHDLVQHTSGIREPNYEEKDWRGLNVAIKQGIDNFKADTLLFPPGTFQLPSTYNFNLLGAVMEEATGQPFQNLLKKYVTDTLGLEHTQVDNPFATIQGRSDFFDHNFIAQVVHATTRDLRYKAPSEGLLSNAEDLVKFGNALLYSDYISAELRNKLFEPVVLEHNTPSRLTNGWIIFQNDSGQNFYGRSGSVTGGSAVILLYPSEKLVIACTTNVTETTEDFPVFQIAGQFLNGSNQEQEDQEKE